MVRFGIALLWVCLMACSQVPVQRNFHDQLKHLPSSLARHQFLVAATPGAEQAPDPTVAQYRAFVEAELGLYHEALRSFPAGGVDPAPDNLPTQATHRAADAVEAILAQARERRIVLINEAHHVGQTRLLTLELLPRLRALGYTHFAGETIDERDVGLMTRGYPVDASGFYSKEPLYGEIIRSAIRLGYTIVAYEYAGDVGGQQARELGQARNLQERVFATQPEARLFVHAGYGHIDKSGQLFDAEPMAVHLARATGLDPLSVDQTRLRSEGRAKESQRVRYLGDAFAPRTPVVLIERSSDEVWSLDPAGIDMTVLLPRSHTEQVRPDWLDLASRRRPWPVSAELCRDVLPCLIEARYAEESDDAVPADRYPFLTGVGNTALYLQPGRYRLTVTDEQGEQIVPARVIKID